MIFLLNGINMQEHLAQHGGTLGVPPCENLTMYAYIFN